MRQIQIRKSDPEFYQFDSPYQRCWFSF